MNEITLPSGAVLSITLADFEDADALWMTVLEEAKGLKMDPEAELDVNLFKDMFCTAMSSKKIRSALWKCFARCRYKDERGDLKIDKDTFEPVKAREDYSTVCFEVGRANILPFSKTLVSSCSQILNLLKKGLAQG